MLVSVRKHTCDRYCFSAVVGVSCGAAPRLLMWAASPTQQSGLAFGCCKHKQAKIKKFDLKILSLEDSKWKCHKMKKCQR